MKSIIKTILSLFLAVSLCGNTKVMASYKIDNFTSNYNFYLNINDGKVCIQLLEVMVKVI